MLASATHYSREELQLLRRVFDDALLRVPKSIRAEASPVIAHRLLDCAAAGERSAEKLRIAAMADMREYRWCSGQGESFDTSAPVIDEHHRTHGPRSVFDFPGVGDGR